MRAPEHSPRGNRLLASLPGEEYARLLPHLWPVDLPVGWVVHAAGEPEDQLYFPTQGIVSRICVTRGGESAEFALTGSEGVIGVASFLGGGSMPTQAVVLIAGRAWRLGGDALRDHLERGGRLADVLLRYTQSLLAQAGQAAVCNRYHSIEQRLARWILASLDRLPSNEMEMTHEVIADMLGVRREGVTEAAGHLQRDGLIRYARGRIEVLERTALQSRCCECYAVMKHEHDRLLGPSHARAVTFPALRGVTP